ncbi:hypothetical protein [Aequorivita echinoideorum]|uniref:Uncharacterized protein n=1 Tax=Aequorivita echinoideorum TaxID=1549647 RepID=A0ABS5S7J7_9FLAO|nr:hypothetical protein [Aequorivita echinoideorum]MBT0609181.1 hypothetical protein [Aequorivita echinoideorum]
MAKQNETGHAVNVENFHKLIQYVTTYGLDYSPSNPELQLPQLTAQHTAAENVQQTLTDQVPLFNAARNARLELFENSDKLATRVINALEVSGVSKEVVKDAKTINNKIQGRRASEPQQVPANTPPPNSISASQKSYVQMAQHWAALVALLENQPAYNPNQPELKVEALDQMQQDMNAANEAVNTAYAQYEEVLTRRDEVLYEPTGGVVAVAALVKKQVKAIYGADSPQFRATNAINFKTFKRK